MSERITAAIRRRADASAVALYFAAKPASIFRVADKAPVATGGLHESYGVTEEDAARACVAKVEEFLLARSKSPRE